MFSVHDIVTRLLPFEQRYPPDILEKSCLILSSLKKGDEKSPSSCQQCCPETHSRQHPVRELWKQQLGKCFTLFSSRGHHSCLFMLVLQMVSISGMCLEDVGKEMQSSLYRVRWCSSEGGILRALHLQRAPVWSTSMKITQLPSTHHEECKIKPLPPRTCCIRCILGLPSIYWNHCAISKTKISRSYRLVMGGIVSEGPEYRELFNSNYKQIWSLKKSTHIF